MGCKDNTFSNMVLYSDIKIKSCKIIKVEKPAKFFCANTNIMKPDKQPYTGLIKIVK